MTQDVARRPEHRLVVGRNAARFAVAAAVYGVFALVGREVARLQGRPPLAAVVGVTVVVATVLWVARDPLDRLVAKVVLGDRASGHEVIQGLLRRMATTLPVDEVVPQVAQAATRTTGRSRAEVRLWLDEGERWSQAWPPSAPVAPGRGHLAVGVSHAGDEVGEIAVDGDDETLSPVDRRLLDALAGPAGLALSTVRLTLALRRRKADLEQVTAALRASSDRLLSARVVEQQRMRAEVTERVIPHIDAAELALGAAALDSAAVEAGLALDALRELARGIYPPRLHEDGLAVSVDGWLLREGLSATIEVTGDVASVRARTDLETCLYFCIVRVLSALSAAGAADLSVSLVAGPTLRLSVSGATAQPLDQDAVDVVTDRMGAFDGVVTEPTESGRRGVVASFPPSAGDHGPPPDGRHPAPASP